MEHFLRIITKPDNIPIAGMLLLVLFCLWVGLRQALENDRRAASGRDVWEKEENEPGVIHVWPYLCRLEFLMLIAVMIGLAVWSIGIDAPLEEPANPTKTPNPSKAPWYFLGLQEMLVYFDPWIAGVVLPGLIIFGLMAIPYLDPNPNGRGHYAFRERKFAIAVFCFGFVFLWVILIILGTFFRGPGWNFFWPWQYWDPHKVVPLINVNLSYKFGIRSDFWAFLFGAAVVGGYYLLGAIYYLLRRGKNETIRKLGILRYSIVAFLFLTMMALPIKMFLRIVFNIKYVWVTPWFNI